MTYDIVPIGKYKGQPLERLMADQPYSEWLLAQAWFLDKYADLAQLLRLGRLNEPQDTPEHNAMIAGLIDQRDAMEWLYAKVTGRDCKSLYAWDMHQELEPKGGDLLVSFGDYLLIEAKPLIGDDFPAVIRQIKAGTATCEVRGFRRPFGVVVARKVEPTNLTLEQVRRQFQLAHVHLVLESELFAAVPAWVEQRTDYINTTLAEKLERLTSVEADLPAAHAALTAADPHNWMEHSAAKRSVDDLERDARNLRSEIEGLRDRLSHA